MLVLIVLLAAVALLLVGLYLQYKWTNRHILAAASRLPCPPALPILGNALFFLGGITNITKDIILFTKEFKKLFCIWVGPVPLFVVSDPSDVQIVLNSSGTLEKDDTYLFLQQYLGNGLLTAPVPIWKRYRRLIAPILHPGNVENFLPVFNDVSKKLVENIEKSARTVDPRRKLFNCAMDAVMRTSISTASISNQLKETIEFLFDMVGRLFTFRLFKIWLHVDWVFNFLYRKEIKDIVPKVSAVLDFCDMEYEREKNLRNDIPEGAKGYEVGRKTGKNLTELWFVHGDDPKEDHTWRDEILTLVVGATDTIVAALDFLLFTLANDPVTQDKVYKEIQDVFGDSDRDLGLSDVNALTYLGQAIMESMRIHGTFPIILRRATKDTKLSKSILPAGSRILLPLHAMGWDADQFPHPEKFLPDRFSPESQGGEQAKRHNYAFLPFSGGPRNCPGKTYAMYIMKIVMVHILRKFKVTTRLSLQDIEYELKVVIYSKTPLILDLEPRNGVTK